MPPLTNIAVLDADLTNIKGDIADYQFSGHADFAPEILTAKRKIYGKLKSEYSANFPSYTDAELETKLANVKDLPNTYLFDKIVYQSIADILLANEMGELYRYYLDKADQIPMKFYVDEDTDSVVDSDEEHYAKKTTFGR